MNVFRIHIRPGGGLANAHFSFAYCLEEQVLGVGWQTYSERPISTWEEYQAEASVHHDDLSRVRYLHDWVAAGDLLWTRCPDGGYYLARATGGWEYRTNARAKEADIVNVVPCQIMPVPAIDDVPGKVIACFRAPRTIQSINDVTTAEYTRHLWNSLTGTATYTLAAAPLPNIFSCLSSEQIEDLLFIYLQTKGWLVVPHSRKADTMSYEYFLIHRETQQRAIVQAKTGHTPLCPADWRGAAHHVILFQAEGHYLGESVPSVECLSPAALREFIREHSGLLPSSISRWSRLAA